MLLNASIRMADRPATAGVPVKLEAWPGMPHDWPVIAEEFMESCLAIQHIAALSLAPPGLEPR